MAMVYKFWMLSDETDNFLREIDINAEATFLEFHRIILRSVGYAKNKVTSFFVCDDDWRRTTEITLIDMEGKSDEDRYVMDKVRLEELVKETGDKLLYVFDNMTERAFFIELREILPTQTSTPRCVRSEGDPPPQEIDFEELEAGHFPNDDSMDENFYGDSDYDNDELDNEGFSGLDNDNPYDDNP